MQTFIFFALIALTATAFDITSYQAGVDSALPWVNIQTEDAVTCLNALTTDFYEIYNLIQTLDFTNITLGLGELALNVQEDLQVTCKPYFTAYYLYVVNNTNITDIEEFKENIKQNYPFIIQYLGNWVQYLAEGQDFNAGYYQGNLFNFLLGTLESINPAAPKIASVPFNKTAFFTEYNAALLSTLLIDAQANVTGLVECSDYVQNATLGLLYIRDNFSELNFGQRLDAVQYLFGLTFDSFRHCDSAFEVIEIVFDPIMKTYEVDQEDFVLNVLSNIVGTFPSLVSGVENEIADIANGDYAKAGRDQAALFYNIFQNLVDFGGFKN